MSALTRKVLAFLLLVASTLPAAAVGGRPSFVIPPHSVLSCFQAALQAASTSRARVEIAEVHALSPATAHEGNPEMIADQLRFDSARNWVQARIRCRGTGVCVPFFVVATLRQPVAVREKETAFLNRVHHKPELLLRRGDKARLVITSHSGRILLWVVALDGGSLGQQVRVRQMGGRALYRATVVAPHLLQAEWPL